MPHPTVNVDLSEILVFARVVQGGSFTAAAAALGMPKSTVSRKLSELEERIGARLLQRTTRKLSLTDVGRIYYEHCVRIVAELEEAQLAVTQLQSTPKGLLRLTAPATLSPLGPILAEYLRLYPEVQVDLVCTDRNVDLVEERFDLALRMGYTPDSTMISRKLGVVRRYLLAAPELIDRLGAPKEPADLERFPCLVFAPVGSTWTLASGSKELDVTVHPRLAINDYDILRSVAREGIGIALLPEYQCLEDVTSARLRRVLDAWASARNPYLCAVSEHPALVSEGGLAPRAPSKPTRDERFRSRQKRRFLTVLEASARVVPKFGTDHPEDGDCLLARGWAFSSLCQQERHIFRRLSNDMIKTSIFGFRTRFSSRAGLWAFVVAASTAPLFSACSDDEDTDGGGTGSAGVSGSGAGGSDLGGSGGMAGGSMAGTAGSGMAGSGGSGMTAGPTGTVEVLTADASLTSPTTVAFRGDLIFSPLAQFDELFPAEGMTAMPDPFQAVSVPLAGGALGDSVALPDDYYPEGIAAAADGTLYIGSMTTGGIQRVPAGSTTAEEFIAGGAIADRGVVGLTIDEDRDILWFCDSNPVAASPIAELVGVSTAAATEGDEVARHVLSRRGAPDVENPALLDWNWRRIDAHPGAGGRCAIDRVGILLDYSLTTFQSFGGAPIRPAEDNLCSRLEFHT